MHSGTYNNARQLLSALGRHIDKRSHKRKPAENPSLAFNQYRQGQAQRVSLLNNLLVEVEPGYRLKLAKAPDIADACHAAFLPLSAPALIPLRQLLGAVSAWEWRKKGVTIAGLDKPLAIHYGVFSPVRGEYLKLVQEAPLPARPIETAVDLGTGTGVIAALLAKRGIQHIIATDTNPLALACAAENFERLDLARNTTLLDTDTFPDGEFDLVVCNPPWLPGRPTSSLESAVYDPDSRMTRHFLEKLGSHLSPQGEGWLIMSDLAELLGLRPHNAIASWIKSGGLRTLARHTTRPVHPRAGNASDPLHNARSRETTTLWRLTKA